MPYYMGEVNHFSHVLIINQNKISYPYRSIVDLISIMCHYGISSKEI